MRGVGQQRVARHQQIGCEPRAVDSERGSRPVPPPRMRDILDFLGFRFGYGAFPDPFASHFTMPHPHPHLHDLTISVWPQLSPQVPLRCCKPKESHLPHARRSQLDTQAPAVAASCDTIQSAPNRDVTLVPVYGLGRLGFGPRVFRWLRISS